MLNLFNNTNTPIIINNILPRIFKYFSHFGVPKVILETNLLTIPLKNKNGIDIPREYKNNISMPLYIFDVVDANVNTAAKIGPEHGIHTNEIKIPITNALINDVFLCFKRLTLAPLNPFLSNK